MKKTLTLMAALFLLAPLAGAQSLDPRWLGTPELADYQNPRAYWQRVLAVWQGAMTADQRALVERNIATGAAPGQVAASPTPGAIVNDVIDPASVECRTASAYTQPGLFAACRAAAVGSPYPEECRNVSPYAQPDLATRCAIESAKSLPRQDLPPVVFRIGARYATDPYHARTMIVIGLTRDAAGIEVVTAQWLDAPETERVGEVFAFKNDGHRPWFPLD